MNMARGFFRLLLFAYPRRTRDEHADDMWLTFQSHLHDARSIGPMAVFHLWRREIIAVWRESRRGRTSSRSPARHYTSPQKKPAFLLRASSLDFKLGLRMLARYPGLTIIGGLGIAIAIAIGVGAFSFVDSFASPMLPFEDGDRLVTIDNWDVDRNGPDHQLLHDFITWRDDATSIEHLGAAVQVTGRSLITEDGRVELVRLAAISASAFQVARVPPLIGRTLVALDEVVSAAPVVVIGFGVWRDVFASDTDVLGKRVRLGNAEYTVVGVMPEGFAFPVNEDVWIPLRIDPDQHERGEGPTLITFGRLADNVSLKEARAELTAIGQRTAITYPETNARLRPLVMPYTLPFVDIDDPQTLLLIRFWQFIMGLVLVVVCVNVAILVYARTATRSREIGIRTALGATRRRVVAQLFIEAFVLSAAAALVGVFLAGVAIRQVDAFLSASVIGQTLPFWLDFKLSSSSIVYATGLTVLSGVIVGVVPGLKATRRDIHSNLQRLGTGGTRATLGGTWTLLIVTQVAVTVAVLPIAAYQTWKQVRHWTIDPGFPVEELLTAQVALELDRQTGEQNTAIGELVTRLESDAAIRSATFARLGLGGGTATRIEVDGLTRSPSGNEASRSGESTGLRVYSNDIDVDLFETFDIQMLGGRAFRTSDLQSGTSSVIVNQSFARDIAPGENPIGSRIRYLRSSGNDGRDTVEPLWYEIVGVADNLSENANFDGGIPTVFHPVAASQLWQASLAIRMRGNATSVVANRIRETAAAVDPTMRVHAIKSKSLELQQERQGTNAIALATVITLFCVVLLSSAGIYALMSFTVAQRRREIGIRTALGGQAHRILLNIFTRAGVQIAIGILVGAGIAASSNIAAQKTLLDDRALVVLLMASLFMTAVGFAAAYGPAKRGLRVQPTEALRDEG